MILSFYFFFLFYKQLSHIPEPVYSVSVGWINQYLPTENLHGFVLTFFGYIIKSMWKEYYVGQNVSHKSNVIFGKPFWNLNHLCLCDWMVVYPVTFVWPNSIMFFTIRCQYLLHLQWCCVADLMLCLVVWRSWGCSVIGMKQWAPCVLRFQFGW